MEEMGFDCELKTMHKFIYKASFSNGLTEHELDYVLKGFYQGEILPNKDEVHNYKWVNLAWLLNDIQHNPDLYTAWFKLILTESVSYLVN
jgi:isopentenyl-diphosphate delta-isomerase